MNMLLCGTFNDIKGRGLLPPQGHYSSGFEAFNIFISSAGVFKIGDFAC